MSVETDLTILKNIVRIGKVSSVDIKKNTARVIFEDKNDLISGELKVVRNQPFVTVENYVDGEKWDCEAHYATIDRKVDEVGSLSYKEDIPEKIHLKKQIDYNKEYPIPETPPQCTYTGKIEDKIHEQVIKVYPWLPYIGQFVLCIYLPNGESDGFVIGGI